MNPLSHNVGSLSILVNKEQSLDSLWNYLSHAVDNDSCYSVVMPFFKKVISNYKFQIQPKDIISSVEWLDKIIKLQGSNSKFFQIRIVEHLNQIIDSLVINGMFSSSNGLDFSAFMDFVVKYNKAISLRFSDEFILNKSLDISMIDNILNGSNGSEGDGNFSKRPLVQFNSGVLSYETLVKLASSSILGDKAKAVLSASKKFEGMPDLSEILNPNVDIKCLCEYVRCCNDLTQAVNVVSLRNYYSLQSAQENLMLFEAYIDGIEDDEDLFSDLNEIVSSFLLSSAPNTQSNPNDESALLILSSAINNQVASMDGLLRIEFYNSILASHILPQKVIVETWQDVESQLSSFIASGEIPDLTFDGFKSLTMSAHKSFMEKSNTPELLVEVSRFLNYLAGQNLTCEQNKALANYKFTNAHTSSLLLENKMKDFGFPEKDTLNNIFSIESNAYSNMEFHHVEHGALSPDFIKYALSSNNKLAVTAVNLLEVIPNVLSSLEVNRDSALEMESFLLGYPNDVFRFIKYGVINSNAVLTNLIVDAVLYIKKAASTFDYKMGDFSEYFEFIQDMSPIDHERCISKILEFESDKLAPAVLNKGKRYSI